VLARLFCKCASLTSHAIVRTLIHFISMCEASLGYGHMMVKGLTVVSDSCQSNAARTLGNTSVSSEVVAELRARKS
jgi:hypothetical protein